MAKVNKDIRLLLHLHEIYAFVLYEELGISSSTYTKEMRKELTAERRVKYFEAIERIKRRKEPNYPN
ncbi:hypothetical protein [Kurthia sibirica]|uniref:hypothetical protein n=1 Tax=Kurthia sibirica TaxID=202750 RepID=UPI001172DD9F|nr:hypothetical protein [Kurthia sibirica]GEK35444.1 hypothetical protein KSI01_29770 [Kurthia sibirica]